MTLGVDVGGTKILLYDTETEEVERYETRNGEVLNLLRNLLSGKRAGIGVPCYLRDGICAKSPHVPELNGVDLRRIFPDTIILNDSSAIAYGEYVLRDSRYDPLLLVSLGTGVGGGLVYRGDVYQGRGSAMEIGHVKSFSQERCGCGKVGCLETSIGGKYAPVERMYYLAKEGRAEALEFFRGYGRNLGRAIACAVQLLDPEIVVIGGSGAKAYDFFIPHLMEEMEKMVSFVDDFRIEPWLAEHSGAMGAALLAQR